MDFEKFAVALRLPFLSVSVISSAVAGALAFHDGAFNPWIFLSATVGVVLAHAGTNLANDYFDYKAGNYPAEKKGPTGGSFAIQSGLFGEGQILTMAVVCFILSVAIFAYLSVLTSIMVLVLGVLGAAIGFFYTAPPLRLGYNHLGELASFIGMGPLIFSTVYLAQAGTVTIAGLLVSVFIGLGISNILLAAEIPDIKEDRSSKKKTVASFWGEKTAFSLFLASAILGAAALLASIILYHLPLVAAIALLGLAFSVHGYMQMCKGRHVEAVLSSIKALELSGVLLILALLV